jgi:hypothetical protein
VLRQHADGVNNWIRHTSAVVALRSVLSALGARGIRALPVKGILTAHTLYADVSERPISDIDLRLARDDFGSLLGIARDRGWEPRVDSPFLWEAVLTVDGWEVDVECTVGDPGLCTLPVAEMMARGRRCVDPFGFEHLQPELHDHVLLLALNSFKDGLRPRPAALTDLLRVVRSEGFVAATLVDRARRGGVMSALWLVADWLARDHSSAQWLEVRNRMGTSPQSARVSVAYNWLLRSEWPARSGMLLAAASNDSLPRAALGLGLGFAGVARGRINRLLVAARGR